MNVEDILLLLLLLYLCDKPTQLQQAMKVTSVSSWSLLKQRCCTMPSPGQLEPPHTGAEAEKVALCLVLI